MMFVTARNRAGTPVIVQLSPSGDAGPSVSFSYDIGLSRYDVRADVPEVTRFAALEVKRFIFDFRVGVGDARYYLRPGTFRFNGAYGGVWAPNPPTVTVSPKASAVRPRVAGRCSATSALARARAPSS